MRLSADLIERSAAFTNTLGERELDLRTNKIPAIENLIASRDLFDAIDLTDNEIKRLENFPRLLRLGSLLLSNNSISQIDTEFFSPKQLPALHSLILTNNRILDLSDLEPLSVFSSSPLRYLSLLDNPVTKKPHYRFFVLSKLPNLKCLDFKRVRPVEVTTALKMFPADGSKTFDIQQADEIMQEAFESDHRPKKRGKLALSDEQVETVKKAIQNAKTLAEVNRLEKILQAGHIPDDMDLKLVIGSDHQ
jgi:U2 small nuclear ribonucleoprotein A'